MKKFKATLTNVVTTEVEIVVLDSDEVSFLDMTEWLDKNKDSIIKYDYSNVELNKPIGGDIRKLCFKSSIKSNSIVLQALTQE